MCCTNPKPYHVQIKRELGQAGSHREGNRKGRERLGLPLVALIGYVDPGCTHQVMRHILSRPGGGYLQHSNGYSYTPILLYSCMCVLLCSIHVFYMDQTTSPCLTYAHHYTIT